MEKYPDEDWERLGQLLRLRRPQLNQRYRIRRVFAEDNHLTDKTVQEIENAYRKTFSDDMIAAIEVAYRLPQGAIEEILKDSTVTEYPHHAGTGLLNFPPEPPAADIPPGVSLQDIEPWERAIWLIPGLTADERGFAIACVRWSRDPKAEPAIDSLGILMLFKMADRIPELLPQLMERLHTRRDNGHSQAG
ncbi:hypothetical protein ACGFNU_21740 [Spirillospora sp. NPDC048911]|uniref:hypothetical protein n=1 Tax=Spirillospora sp. NPDC048911 TaxID=3364527 RepID=UPI003721B6D1